ncbi:hypothetical protein [Acetivibrio cellulolyticus]|uniref:hypothetical protein n=1 Tax=Acetivibrio cellulolyticus TaxID=35830 RepID=UPI0002481B1F|nr:hypothetical protein [Acetivibrio cellulolyticus]
MKGKKLSPIVVIGGSGLLAIIILFGILIAAFIPSESIKNINIKDENIIQTFEKEFYVELVEGSSILNMGMTKLSGFSPDGPSISYYSKIVIPESKLDEFKINNNSRISQYPIDEETFEFFMQVKKKFSWWDFKFEEVEFYSRVGQTSTEIIYCKPQNGNVTIFIRS